MSRQDLGRGYSQDSWSQVTKGIFHIIGSAIKVRRKEKEAGRIHYYDVCLPEQSLTHTEPLLPRKRWTSSADGTQWIHILFSFASMHSLCFCFIKFSLSWHMWVFFHHTFSLLTLLSRGVIEQLGRQWLPSQGQQPQIKGCISKQGLNWPQDKISLDKAWLQYRLFQLMHHGTELQDKQLGWWRKDINFNSPAWYLNLLVKITFPFSGKCFLFK